MGSWKHMKMVMHIAWSSNMIKGPLTPVFENSDQAAKFVVEELKRTKGWFSGRFFVNKPVHLLHDEDVEVGVKAFGKWAQRVEVHGIKGEVPEQRSWKAFQSELSALILRLL